MKNVLVTGGAGFIGSHLCERLIEQGRNVISIDNYSTGSKKNHIRGVYYLKLDTKDIKPIAGFKPDLVFHLGEYSRVEQSFDEPSKVWEYNLLGTQRVLDYVRDHKAKLIYAGSSTKFADPNGSPYAFSKATNTMLIRNYARWCGEFNYAITYFYNNYGPREISSGKYSTVIAKFIERYRVNKPLEITLPGIQVRNFTHVYDTVDALLLVAEHGKGDGYEIGNPKSYSILDIAKMFDTEIIFTPERQGNRIDGVPPISEKVIKLGWNPTRSIEDYIKREISK